MRAAPFRSVLPILPACRVAEHPEGTFDQPSAFSAPGGSMYSRMGFMDQSTRQDPESRRKSVVILSDRSREIVRLFEERQQKRQAEQTPPTPTPSDRPPDFSRA
jgi:hypothetical protein